MRYYPTFAIGRPLDVRTEEFFFTGQGYVEAISIAALGFVLSWIRCLPFIKYFLFLAALPAIHFLFTKRVNAQTPGQVLHYRDINRPLNPDE